ncbi:hypothetical protein JCM17823_11220 [Halorubrum gandharaense]
MLKNNVIDFIDEYDLDFRGYYYYMVYKVRSLIRPSEVFNPFEIIYVDPCNVNLRRKTGTIHKWTDMGNIKDGDWDIKATSLDKSDGYIGTYKHFKYNIEWEDTKIYNQAKSKLEMGNRCWGCSDINDLCERLDDLDSLYHQIKKSGFKPSVEVHNSSIKNILLSREFRNSKTDVAIGIGRNGEYILVGGHHRLAIAKALELNKIPVRVVAVHPQWKGTNFDLNKMMKNNMI